MPLGKLRVLCIHYFSKTKSKPAKKIMGQCCSTEMEFTCENSATLEQETKTTKIGTYSLFPLASSFVIISLLAEKKNKLKLELEI